MLRVEKRLRARKPGRVFAKVFADWRLEARPLRTDERIALHLAPPHKAPLLSEEPPPGLLRIVLPVEALRIHLLFGKSFPSAAPCVDIMVARGNHQLDGGAIRSLPVRKHFAPYVCELLKIAYETGVGDIAGAQHRIDPL